MSNRRKVWETLSNLLARLEQSEAGALENEVRKLGKTQFKANMLAEKQMTGLEKALSVLDEHQAQQAELVETLVAERVATVQQAWLESLLPVLDGLDNAIASGQKYLALRDRAAVSPKLTPVQAALLVSPADRAKLASWLDGLRLVRERLLAVLETGEVTPIATVGHPFDPYLHVAVATSYAGNGAAGTIAAEERRGYRTPKGVLRYADVIVYTEKVSE